MFDLSGKAALVTGASGGIGGAIARALHAQGATVALSGTRADALQRLEAALGVPVVAEVPEDDATARRVDAGVLATRLPRSLERALRGVA